MAHTVVGIDLGAHAVKFVLVEVGFRQSRVLRRSRRWCRRASCRWPSARARRCRWGWRACRESTLYMALPGEMLALRVLDLPFSDARKIEQVVGYELEGQIVHALQDVVFDHVVLQAARPKGPRCWRRRRASTRWATCWPS